MGDSQGKRGRGRPTKGQTAMSVAERQAARRLRLRQAETALLEAKEAARMVYKWSDMLQISLRHGRSWQVEQNAYELRTAISKLHKILLD